MINQRKVNEIYRGHILRHGRFIINIWKGKVAGKRREEDLDYPTSVAFDTKFLPISKEYVRL